MPGSFWNILLEKNRAYYYAHMDQETEEGQEKKQYLKLCRKRAEHIPLQHLTGTGLLYGI